MNGNRESAKSAKEDAKEIVMDCLPRGRLRALRAFAVAFHGFGELR